MGSLRNCSVNALETDGSCFALPRARRGSSSSVRYHHLISEWLLTPKTGSDIYWKLEKILKNSSEKSCESKVCLFTILGCILGAKRASKKLSPLPFCAQRVLGRSLKFCLTKHLFYHKNTNYVTDVMTSISFRERKVAELRWRSECYWSLQNKWSFLLSLAD